MLTKRRPECEKSPSHHEHTAPKQLLPLISHGHLICCYPGDLWQSRQPWSGSRNPRGEPCGLDREGSHSGCMNKKCAPVSFPEPSSGLNIYVHFKSSSNSLHHRDNDPNVHSDSSVPGHDRSIGGGSLLPAAAEIPGSRAWMDIQSE